MTHQVANNRRGNESRHGKGRCLVLSALPRECNPYPVNDETKINRVPIFNNGVMQANPRLNRRQFALQEDPHKEVGKVNNIPDAEGVHVRVVCGECPH